MRRLTSDVPSGKDTGVYISCVNLEGKKKFYLWGLLAVPHLLSHDEYRILMQELTEKVELPAFRRGARGELDVSVRVAGVPLTTQPCLVAFFGQSNDDVGDRLVKSIGEPTSSFPSRRSIIPKTLFSSAYLQNVGSFARDRFIRPRELYAHISTLSDSAQTDFLRPFGLHKTRPPLLDIPYYDDLFYANTPFCFSHSNKTGLWGRDKLPSTLVSVAGYIDIFNSIIRDCSRGVRALQTITCAFKSQDKGFPKLARLTAERTHIAALCLEVVLSAFHRAPSRDVNIDRPAVEVMIRGVAAQHNMEALLRNYVPIIGPLPECFPFPVVMAETDPYWFQLHERAKQFNGFDQALDRLLDRKKKLLAQIKKLSAPVPHLSDTPDVEAREPVRGSDVSSVPAAANTFSSSGCNAREAFVDLELDIEKASGELLRSAEELAQFHSASDPPFNPNDMRALVRATAIVAEANGLSAPSVVPGKSWYAAMCNRHRIFLETHVAVQREADRLARARPCTSCGALFSVLWRRGRSAACEMCRDRISSRSTATGAWIPLDFSQTSVGSVCESPNLEQQAWSAFITGYLGSVGNGDTDLAECKNLSTKSTSKNQTNGKNVSADTLIADRENVESRNIIGSLPTRSAHKNRPARAHGDTCGNRQSWSVHFENDNMIDLPFAEFQEKVKYRPKCVVSVRT